MQTLSRILPATALAIAVLVFSGCETESAGTASVSINPGYARITAGQSVALSASGGNDYRWSLSNGSYGHLSASSGSSVVYTASKDGVTQIVTLNSTLGSSSFQCQATIVQGNAEYASTVTPTTSSSSSSVTDKTPQSATNTVGTLSISPSSATFSTSQKTKTFTAAGGSGNYTWQLATGAYGSLNRNTGQSVTYTSSYTGTSKVTDTLTLRDTLGGETKTATITHQPYAAEQYTANDSITVKK